MTHVAKILPFENHSRNILHDKNHLYGIIVVHLTSHKTLTGSRTKNFFLNRQNSASLTMVTSLEAKQSSAQPQFCGTITKLTSGICFLGFQQVCALCTLSFFLSSIKLFLCLPQATKPYQGINFLYQCFL